MSKRKIKGFANGVYFLASVFFVEALTNAAIADKTSVTVFNNSYNFLRDYKYTKIVIQNEEKEHTIDVPFDPTFSQSYTSVTKELNLKLDKSIFVSLTDSRQRSYLSCEQDGKVQETTKLSINVGVSSTRQKPYCKYRFED